jgi:DNA-binding NarL/FixJ family response regulator
MIRLLVADDHAAMRATVVGTLEAEYQVVGAVGDGQEMLDAEAEHNPDVIVLDISMPTLNGIEAAHRLKKRGSKARIIFLTVHDEPELLQAALNTGADGYVIKSRMASDLRPAVREAMFGRRFISPSLRMLPGESSS